MQIHGRHDDQNRQRRAERQEKRWIENRQRIGNDQDGGNRGERVQRWATMIDRARAKIDHRHQRRAIDRRTATDELGVDHQQDDRGEHRRPTEQAGDPEYCEQQAGKNRNVAARDSDYVIGARFLQAPLQRCVQ